MSIFYKTLNTDNSIDTYTDNLAIATQLGWQDNVLDESEIEVSDLDGKTYKKGYAPKKSQEQILDEAKEARYTELSALSDKIFNSQDTYLTSSLGFRINARSKALEDINSLIVLADETTYFNDFDDVIHALTLDQLKVLQKEVIKSGQLIYQQKWNYRTQIANATSVDDINAIKFEFVMADFSEVSNE